MELPFQQQQLNFLIELATHRTPFLDSIFVFLNYFDTPYFAVFLIPFIWFGFSHRTGLQVSFLFLATSIVNSWLKYALHLPRPTVAMPEIGMFLFKSPGFPSGGAQTAFLFGMLLMYRCRNLPAYILGISYILLISFSRLYLGLHYPIDILGGWVAGGALFLLFILLEKPIDLFLKKEKKALLFWIIAGVLLTICLTTFYPLTGAILSLSVGALVALKYDLYPITPKPFWGKMGKGLLAALISFIFCALIPGIIPLYLFAVLIGLWVSLGIPLFFSPWRYQN